AVPVTISKFNVEWLVERITPRARERLHVGHCGGDLPTIPFPAGGRGPGLIMTVGRFGPLKGFDVLIDAPGGLQGQGGKVGCRIIGEAKLEPQMRAAIARHGLDDAVELTGAMPSAEVRKSLYAASVFVLPSVVAANGDRDGIPVSLMEAMAAGTPSVS